MRKKIMAFVFASALLMALVVPMFGGVGTASAFDPPPAETPNPQNRTPGCPALAASGPGQGAGTAGKNDPGDHSAHGTAKLLANLCDSGGR